MRKLEVCLILTLISIVLVSGCTQQPTGRALEVNADQQETPVETQQSPQVTADPCDGVTCSNYCSGNTRYFSGYCKDGQCKYSSDYCQDGCSDGRCKPAPPKVYGVGDTIQMSGLKIRLNGVRSEYHIGTYYTYMNQYQNEAKAGYKYYIVSVTVENTGSESEYVLASDLTLIDSDKNQYEYFYGTYSLPLPFESKNLLSGARNSGEIAFEVPENAQLSKLYYEIDSYRDIYAIWDISKNNVSATSAKECGNAGQSCCEGQCGNENVCSGGVCVACGKDNQLPCSDGCYYGHELISGTCKKDCNYGQIRVGGICQDCGGNGQTPCESGNCDYGYELLNGDCIKECSYGQLRINGICTDCGGLNEPCCSGSCDYGKVCKNSVCVNCGDEAGQPCCPGESKCLSFPTTTCVNDVCQYCGRSGEMCCEGSKCNAGQICKSGVCEECGSTGQQCCGPENYYDCFIGSCQGGICTYP